MLPLSPSSVEFSHHRYPDESVSETISCAALQSLTFTGLPGALDKGLSNRTINRVSALRHASDPPLEASGRTRRPVRRRLPAGRVEWPATPDEVEEARCAKGTCLRPPSRGACRLLGSRSHNRSGAQR